MSDLIEQIAKARGIANDYVDASGNQVFISRENKIECLKAMGYSVDNEQELAAVFGVRSIPTILFVPKEGKPMVSQGALPKDEFIKQINEFLLDKK